MSINDGDIADRLQLRTGNVKEFHIRDDAVATAKIQSLAVTVAKTEEPFEVVALEESVTGFTLNTTDTQHLVATVAVPTWAGSASIFIIAQLQFSNTTGGTINGQLRAMIAGSPASGVLSQSVANNEGTSVIDFQKANIAAPGSTITYSAAASVNSGSGTSPYLHIGGYAVFTR